MSVSALTASNSNQPAAEQQKAQAQMLQTAKQFEAILLQQLTSALSGSNSDDEDSLFGGDAGSGMAKQMFAEQMATTLAESGGIGLSDLIMNQFQGGQTKQPAADFKQNIKTAVSAVRESKTLAPQKLSSEDIIFGDSSESISATNSLKNSRPNAALSSSAGFEIVEQAEMNEDALASNAFVASVAQKTLAENGVRIDPKLNRRDAKLQAIFNEISSAPTSHNEQNLFRATRPRIVPEPLKADEINSSVSVSQNNLQPEAKGFSPAASAVNYQSPVEGRLSSSFGNRFHPVDRKVKFHKGVDIAAPRGTPINSAAEGKVVFAGWSKGYGNMVVIEHADGRQTRYGHADKLFVTEGETVSAGQNIAAVGSTGKSTGPHLHFEIMENGHQINPLNFISKDF